MGAITSNSQFNYNFATTSYRTCTQLCLNTSFDLCRPEEPSTRPRVDYISIQFNFLRKLFHCKTSLQLRNDCRLNSVKMLDFVINVRTHAHQVQAMTCTSLIEPSRKTWHIPSFWQQKPANQLINIQSVVEELHSQGVLFQGSHQGIRLISCKSH